MNIINLLYVCLCVCVCLYVYIKAWVYVCMQFSFVQFSLFYLTLV